MEHKRLIRTRIFTLHWYPYLKFGFYNAGGMWIISVGFLTMTLELAGASGSQD